MRREDGGTPFRTTGAVTSRIGALEAGLAVQFVALAGLSRGTAGALTFVIRLATLWFATLIGDAEPPEAAGGPET